MNESALFDIVIVQTSTGMVVHRLGCPEIDKIRAQLRPIMTLFGCTGPLPPDLHRHDCMRHGQN